MHDIWVESWKAVCSATVPWHKGCKNINEAGRLKGICERGIYWGTSWCGKEGNCGGMWQVRRFGDAGPEQGQGWAKIPGISMDNCACDTGIRFFHGNSAILIRFFSTKEKMETRAMRSVYVFGFSTAAIQSFLFDSLARRRRIWRRALCAQSTSSNSQL